MTALLKLDVVIVATIRAEILRMTLDSFCKNFLHQFKIRVIVNVDPIGETDKNTQMDIVEICREYFDEVIYNCPENPSYAKAVVWGWNQVKTDLFLNLEDDWILKRELDFEEVTAPFADPNVVNVCFNKFGIEQALADMQQRKYEMNWYDNLFIHRPYISYNPGLFRTAYMQKLAEKLDIHKDPEFQWNPSNNMTADYPKPVFLWRMSQESLLIDTGSRWRKVHDIRKHGGPNTETYWHKHISNSVGRRIFGKLRQANRLRKYYFIKRNWKRKYCQPLNSQKKS